MVQVNVKQVLHATYLLKRWVCPADVDVDLAQCPIQVCTPCYPQQVVVPTYTTSELTNDSTCKASVNVCPPA